MVVELSDEDAQLFVLFQRYRESFGRLIAGGVFDVRQGSATLHFDGSGHLRAIDTSEVVHCTFPTNHATLKVT